MIKTLYISNYALIDEIEIAFGSGFNIITGETGAGKSIILGALSLLMGGRADVKVIRRNERKSVIEAVFSLDDAPGVEPLIHHYQLDTPVEGECLLRRELLPGGRSRAFVNDTPVTLPVLREIGEHLVDIHSQHQNRLLAAESYQLEIIDGMAGNRDLLDNYRKAYAAFRVALKQYTETRDMLRRTRDDAEFLKFQYEQLAALNLHPGEREQLEKERELLSNSGDIKENLAEALQPLSEGQVNVLELIDAASAALETLADTLDEEAGGDVDYRVLSERLESARIEIADIADTLAECSESVAADPERLDFIEQRLSTLYSLEMKHHVDNTDGLIALRDNLEGQIAALEDGDNILHALETAAKRAKREALTLAQELSERRSAAATGFAQELCERGRHLGMPNLRCSISFEKNKLGADGFDNISFLFAFNKNQDLMPVGNTASGGEISRLMLVIKSIVAERMHLPSIIFDEVDTGVSGDIAGRMGAMMADMSRYLQVITITHLPGVAALGHRHFKVYKEDDELATTTRIMQLDADAREAEIALMISGSRDDSAARANARALLAKADLLNNNQSLLNN